MGSKTALKIFANALIFTGVLVSKVPLILYGEERVSTYYAAKGLTTRSMFLPFQDYLPRKAENPTNEIMDGKKAKARINKYGLA